MTTQSNGRRVLLAGATGLVGSMLLQALLADGQVEQVHALSRRMLNISHPKLQVHIVDFNHLPALPEVDEVYLALGTTIKVAGSQDAFRAVDLNANLAVARAAVAAGARRVGLVSAVGASARSSTFYNRVKGELEDALKTLDLLALVIAQPSLLLDKRDGLQQPPRLGERFAIQSPGCWLRCSPASTDQSMRGQSLWRCCIPYRWHWGWSFWLRTRWLAWRPAAEVDGMMEIEL